MDYETKPTCREDLRRLSAYFRRLFNVPPDGPFPVLEALEKVPDVFEGSVFQIVEDNKMPLNTPARCTQNDSGGFTLEIKESVYEGAFEKRIGAYRGFICHEICHVFLFSIGFVPIYSRSFEEGKVPAYRSVEWQTKALCAEVMIPYEESCGMKQKEIIAKYHVSMGFAENRIKLDKARKQR